MNYYQLHGLTIAADFQMMDIESIAFLEKPDITLRFGKVDEERKRLAPFAKQDGMIYHEGELLFIINSIGQFFFPNKNNVIVQLEKGCSIEKAMPYIYSNVITALLQMRDLFTIHGSGVMASNGLNLFSGQSGIGKSTLATHLFNKGFPLFCDDRAVLYWKALEKCFYAKPSMPTIRLMADAVDKVDNKTWLKNQRVVDYKKDKYEFDIKESIIKEEQRIQHLYIIRNIKGQQIQTVPISGNRKMTLLKKQSFKAQFINVLGKQKEHFLFLSQIMQVLPISVIRRPVDMPITDFSHYVATELLESN